MSLSYIDNSRAQYRTRKHSKEDFRGRKCWTSLNPAGASLYHSSKLPDGNGATGNGGLVALCQGAERGMWSCIGPDCGMGVQGWRGARFTPPWQHAAGLVFFPFSPCFCCPTCKERSFGGDHGASWFDTAEVFWKTCFLFLLLAIGRIDLRDWGIKKIL